MFDFDGNTGGKSRVDLGGRGHGRNKTRGTAEDSRSDFVKRQHREREGREQKRIRDRAAVKIQAAYRGHRCLRAAQAVERQVFDKRHADIVKVVAELPTDKKARFAFHALLPMLRLFTFFFSGAQDRERLSATLELMLFSAGQPLSYNILQLAVADDDVQRRSMLVLLERLIAALLRAGRTDEAARLLVALQATLVEEPRLGGALGHLLQRTDALPAMARSVLTQATARPAEATELVFLFCNGLEHCTPVKRLELLVHLLSAPRLGAFLCEAAGPRARECLQRLSHMAVEVPAAGAFAGILAEKLNGSMRRAWLLGTLITTLEFFLLGGHCPGSISSWVFWISWAKNVSPSVMQDCGVDEQLLRLHRTGLTRMLLRSMGTQSHDQLLASICQLYFASPDGAEDGEPPAEVLQTLAFATSFAERLFPTLAGLITCGSDKAVFAALGAPTFATPEASNLRVFCAVYALQLQPMYDCEFFGPANPLRPEHVQCLALFLNRVAYHFVTTWPDRRELTPTARALRSNLISLLSTLYNRHLRRSIILGDGSWIINSSKLLLRRSPIVDLGIGQEEHDEDPGEDSVGADANGDYMDLEQRSFGAALAGRSEHSANRVLEAVLEEIPHVLPFEDRVSLLHNVIRADQDQRRDTRGPWAQSMTQRHQIRRNFLVKDGLAAFEGLVDEGALRDVFRVEFISTDGEPESGVDGGGLFKEFMIHICREMFDPGFGLFAATCDQTLYPAVSACKTHADALDLYAFLGKVVGKGIYEMFLLEPQFSRVFLNRLLGRVNDADDVVFLDKELHRNMLRIKESQHVEELNLTFSVTISDLGHCEEIDLIPDGRNVPVTRDNLTRYFHLFANYKTNVQFQRHTAAFLRGLQCVIPLAWLKMFDPCELNLLVSGSSGGFDVEDLKRNTIYSGGYSDDSPVIRWLWTLSKNMEPEDMGRFLMFVTSCSRAPLLGFKTLYPLFCVHRVPDSVRLPTASTCANLLKLPDYTSFEVLKTKVLQAIRSEAGFDLA